MSFLRELAGRWPYFVISGVILAFDQITKVLAHSHLRAAASVEVIPGFFNLAYSRNRGGLFGYFSDLTDPWRTILLTLLPLVAIGLIMVSAQTLFIQCMRNADTSFAAPFFYTTLVFAAGYDLVIFDVWPDAISILGTVIIVGAAVVLAVRGGRPGVSKSANRAISSTQ